MHELMHFCRLSLAGGTTAGPTGTRPRLAAVLAANQAVACACYGNACDAPLRAGPARAARDVRHAAHGDAHVNAYVHRGYYRGYYRGYSEDIT